MSPAESIVVDTTERILADLCDPQTLNHQRDEDWVAPLWEALERAGLTRAWVPERLGGAGVSLLDGFDVVRVAGSFAVPLPLVETLAAGWLLASAGIEVPPGPITLAAPRRDARLRVDVQGRLHGRAPGVPFAAEATRLAALAHRDDALLVALLDRPAYELGDDASVDGQPRAEVRFDGALPAALGEAPPGLGEDADVLLGAAVRSTQMAGALQSVLDLAVEHANGRVAFERPIGKFQAIQHALARLASEAAAALAAARSAADSLAQAPRLDDDGVFLEVASAKIRVGEAVGEGAAIAHQVHGAIGFTREHVLHRYTTRMWAWRDDFGGESEWAVRLGSAVASRGADALWPMLAAR